MNFEKKLYSIANEAGTTYLVPSCLEFISKNTQKFKEEGDQELTKCRESLKDNGEFAKIRFSSKKYEKVLHSLLSDIGKRSTRKDLMEVFSEIMIQCGYISYLINQNRFKQMIENRKKAEKREIRQIVDRENSDNLSDEQDDLGIVHDVFSEIEEHDDYSQVAPNISNIEEEIEENHDEDEFEEINNRPGDTSFHSIILPEINNNDS